MDTADSTHAIWRVDKETAFSQTCPRRKGAERVEMGRRRMMKKKKKKRKERKRKKKAKTKSRPL